MSTTLVLLVETTCGSRDKILIGFDSWGEEAEVDFKSFKSDKILKNVDSLIFLNENYKKTCNTIAIKLIYWEEYS